MDNKRASLPPMVGAGSLMVIFAVLCLTVFALLSVATVRADQRLSEKSAAAVEGYYAADCAAEEILARLRAGQLPAGVSEENGVFSFNCPISDTQELCVELKLENEDYTVLRWQTVSTTDWQADDKLHVWNGE